jgi:hypothetical protein
MVSCVDDCSGGHDYALPGPQVEPSAGLWQFCAKLRIVGIDEMRALTDDPTNVHYFPPYPTKPAVIEAEYEELIELSRHRDDPCYIIENTDKKPPVPICHFQKDLPGVIGRRRPLSRLWNLCPYPLGGVLVNRFPGEQVVRTGRGLARAIESETPGLYHRHIANVLMKTRNWSPPRQALVWAALDIAIASALQAAWYYKWVAQGRDQGHCTAYRQRPYEYRPFDVLFDHPDELNPKITPCPQPSPGTPRHPAYPSGHSTYSAAGSEILSFFFGSEDTPPFLGEPKRKLAVEFDYLADNIGLGRMWAGVHWRSDHEAGQKLGRTIACLVLQQLASMRTADEKTWKVETFDICPEEPPKMPDQCEDKQPKCDDTPPPKRSKICKAADEVKAKCPPKDDTPVPDCKAEPKGDWHTRVDAYRGPQQGAK